MTSTLRPPDAEESENVNNNAESNMYIKVKIKENDNDKLENYAEKKKAGEPELKPTDLKK